MRTGLIRALGIAAGLMLVAGSAAVAAGQAPEKALLFYPSHLAWDPQAKAWRGEIRGKVFEREQSAAVRNTLHKTLGAVAHATLDDDKVFDSRVEQFAVKAEGGKRVIVDLGGRSFRSRRSKGSGHFSVDVTLAEGSAGAAVLFRARLDLEGSREVEGMVRLVGPKGIAVISDIDDTVKDSNVPDLEELVANTFFRPYRTIPGMADLYGAWGDEGAAIIFVTASPWQLFPPLWSFLADSRFSAVGLEMRDVRLTGASVVDLVRGPRAYKARRIREVLKQFPERTFVLVGDSGERDPEVYAALAEEFPEQVRGIFIRAVRADHLAPSWRQKIFAGIDDKKCVVFADAAALPRDLAGWLRSQRAGD